ncbi:tetratricopeptide repeat protein [Xanthobacter autotrophicus]|uniref:tetratricopeptide repeat protein n=1 Tax=Xanthobacter autotrophicus TaxID=280 RepID=UPI003726551B
MRGAIIGAVLALLIAPAWAGPREDMAGAYMRKDYKAAWALARPLADQNDEVAQYLVGSMLRDGTGVAKDNFEAVQWLRKAAEQGNVAAQCELGFLLAFGMGSMGNAEDARMWLKKAADAGYPTANAHLGRLIRSDKVATPDPVAAVGLFRTGAAMGDAESQYQLAGALRDGWGVPKDTVAAADIYCAMTADPAQYECGKLVAMGLARDKDAKKGIANLARLAAIGNRAAQAELGYYYLNGYYTDKNIAEGARLTALAAKQGISSAQYTMGAMAERGIGAAKDLKVALEWYDKAAQEGYAPALVAAGRLLEDDQAGPPDLLKAMEYYRRAADLGSADAKTRWAAIYKRIPKASMPLDVRPPR